MQNKETKNVHSSILDSYESTITQFREACASGRAEMLTATSDSDQISEMLSSSYIRLLYSFAHVSKLYERIESFDFRSFLFNRLEADEARMLVTFMRPRYLNYVIRDLESLDSNGHDQLIGLNNQILFLYEEVLGTKRYAY